MAQSSAIAEFLEEKHPEPALLPADRNLRAVVGALLELEKPVPQIDHAASTLVPGP